MEQDGVYEEERSTRNLWNSIVGKATITAIAYPFEYVKVLVQIGHEPLPPRPTRRFLGKPALALPGAFEYMGYIKSVDGFFGLYRGLSIKLCSNIISGAVFTTVNKNLPQVNELQNDDEITEEQRILNFIHRTLKEMLSKCAGIICSQPFHVITLRCMSQFVGREEHHCGLFSSVSLIYKQEGIKGLFSGLIPRLIGEVLTIWFANTIAFVINAYIVEDKTLQNYVSATTMFLSSSVTYPFSLVGNIMAVSGSGLSAGQPPNMPVYVNWTECWTHLSSMGQLKRGSSILWRYYQGPFIVDASGTPRPVGQVKLKPPVASK